MGMEQLLTALGKTTENLTLASFLLITFLSLMPVFTILSKRINEFEYKHLHIKFHNEENKQQRDEPPQTKITKPKPPLATTSPETHGLRPRGKGSGKSR
jgi:hypothetical protein